MAYTPIPKTIIMGIWKSLKNSKPEIGKLVELKHMITGIGAPEREGWESVGRLRESGHFTIKQNKEKTVDFRNPTHWREIKPSK